MASRKADEALLYLGLEGK